MVQLSCNEIQHRRYGLVWAWFQKGLLSHTRLLPYLGLETVVEDEGTAASFVKVLQGKFEQLDVADLQTAFGGAWMRDGPGSCVPLIAGRAALSKFTKLLQVTDGDGIC